MKTIIKILAVALLLLATFSPQTAGAATSGYRYKGLSAQLNYYTGDEMECVYSEIWVFAGNEVFHERGTPRNTISQVSVSIAYDNWCKGISYYVYGSAPLSASDFQIDRNLGSATLTKTVPVSNWWSSASFDAVINLTWTATTPLGHRDEHMLMSFDGYHVNQHVKGAFRYAEVTGVISDGTTNFLEYPSLSWGLLYNAKEGSMSREPGIQP